MVMVESESAGKKVVRAQKKREDPLIEAFFLPSAA